MALSSSTVRTLLSSKTNTSLSKLILPSTLKPTTLHQNPRHFTASATISASASTSKKSILQKLHLKSPFSSFSSSSSPPPSPSSSSSQSISVYEINEGDRKSPAFLKLSKAPEKCLGDIVTFSNKLYSGDLSSRLGITAGMIMYIEKDEGGGDRYEAVYSFYFGKFGHVSVQGPYYSSVDSELAVTGGTGVFEGVRGKVKLTNVAYPFKLFYTFDLKGIGRLPEELVGGEVVTPSPVVKPLTASSVAGGRN